MKTSNIVHSAGELVYNERMRKSLFLTLLLAGCGSASTDVDESQAEHLEFETDFLQPTTFLGEVSAPQKIRLKNTSSRTISTSWQIESENDEFSVDASSCPMLAANGVCEVSVTFAPVGEIGERSATVTVTDVSAESIKELLVSFKGKVLLTVNKSLDGRVNLLTSAGAVDRRINCGGSNEQCEVELEEASDRVVTLKAFDGSVNYFSAWTNDCSGTDLECTLTMDGNKTVASAYEPYLRLSVQILEDPLHGDVFLSPSSSGACTPTGNNNLCGLYRPGTNVTMNAVAAPGYMFENWFGFSGCVDDEQCDITLNSGRQGTVSFCQGLACSE